MAVLHQPQFCHPPIFCGFASGPTAQSAVLVSGLSTLLVRPHIFSSQRFPLGIIKVFMILILILISQFDKFSEPRMVIQ